LKETELFAPIRDHFTSLGYEVAAEVNHCDVVAVKDDEIVIIELKRSLNITLLTQAVDRQSLTPKVYLAIPEPANPGGRRFKAQQRVVKRLGLGLITVYESPLRVVANIRQAPDWQGSINARRRDRLLKEVAGRTLQRNIGGATRIPVYTAYRETAVMLANLLLINGPSRVAELRGYTGEKTQSILSRNIYGWFVRESRGIYSLTETGRCEIADYPELNDLARQLLRNQTPS
jgi:hypothetical protein